ncbi:Cupin domain-containing protein (plasmid) [Nitratireductor aquimarinus]|uniref:cupin domain-containing protein n=1 Tax=Nitratireductor aquimarinus TaxID=889300 RepID=UPI003B593BFA
MAKIGHKISDLRRRRQLTVRELSARSGVSHSTISLIEREKVSPSLNTLQAILDALGSTLVGFLSDVHLGSHSPFYKAQDLVEIGNVRGISYRLIGINHPNRALQFLKETYKVGADTGGDLSHEGQEAGYVISGQIEVTVGDKKRVLGPGDAYYFDSREKHRFRNVGDEPAEIVSAITPPTY